MGKDDPFTFVDLDDCRNPETGDVAPWAMEIVRELDSYTEVSSSGKGLHIIVEGEKPGPRCRTNALPAFEMYDDVRPALITGDRLNEKDIEPRQPQIEDLYHEVFPPEVSDPVDIEPTGLDDDEVLRLLTEVDPEAPKWRTTLNGDWGEHYDDRSGADFAIAYKLGFYSGDPEQVQRIMNASGHARRRATHIQRQPPICRTHGVHK